jgi:hypothetical protein
VVLGALYVVLGALYVVPRLANAALGPVKVVPGAYVVPELEYESTLMASMPP